MLGHASNLGRGDRGKFAAKVMVDFRDLLNLVNGHDICKSSFEKIKVKKCRSEKHYVEFYSSKRE